MKAAAFVLATAILALASTSTLATHDGTEKVHKASTGKEARKRVASLEGERLTQAKIDSLHRQQKREVEARNRCQLASMSC